MSFANETERADWWWQKWSEEHAEAERLARNRQHTCPAHANEVRKGGACVWCQLVDAQKAIEALKLELAGGRCEKYCEDVKKARSEASASRKALDAFVAAARKQEGAIHSEFGGWGHASWCNYPKDDGSGKGRCNCGVADMLSALRDYDSTGGSRLLEDSATLREALGKAAIAHGVLLTALEKYGRHLPGCNRAGVWDALSGPCTCGLGELLSGGGR